MDRRQDPQTVYGEAETVRVYEQLTDFLPAESAWVREGATLLRDSRLLDLGVGAGRTTTLLAPLVREYVAVDYVPELVAAARRRFPGLDVRVGDARSLGEFADGSFDVVVFSFNGLDTLSEVDRPAVLAEVRRILRPGGTFFFSGHNLDFPGSRRLAWPERPRLSRLWLHRSARRITALVRHLRMRRHERSGPGWAIINDQAHDYRLLHFYATRTYQEEQLASAGFEVSACYTSDGSHSVGTDTSSPELHYWCVKS